MKIAVIGPGGIGCLFAGMLAESGQDVVLIDRRPERAALISREGLIIERSGQARMVALRACAFPADIGPVDLIILCVKAHETAGTVPSVTALFAPRTKILSLQNGLGNLEVFRRTVAGGNLLAGITTHGTTVIGLNHIRHAGPGSTMIGSLNQNDQDAALIAKTLSKAGIDSTPTADTLGMLWSKLIINAAICPVSVLADLANGEIAGSDKWRELLCKAADEGGRVAAAKGIKLTFADPAGAVLEVCEKTASNISSMLQDIRRGRKTEIMEINGAVLRTAAELGIEAPANEMLLEKVVELEKHKEYKKG
jgi:2-dehydropantoate 2-reductase